MASLPIKIYIRTRPTTDFASENIKILDDHQTVTINIDKSDPLNFLNTPECNYLFKFHSILHNVSQEIVFEEAAREIVDSFIQGYNGCIFSFGQRGSGKTFTMFGGIRHFKYRGIVPRTLGYIFTELEKFKTINFTLSVQYFQIFNDIVYDLLSDEEKEMQVAEDETGNTYVQNLSAHEVSDVHSAISLLIKGDSKLSLGEHKHNRSIHRSHCVFVLDLVGRKGTRMTRSRLYLLDLAASEEASDCAYVNKSISYMQQLVVSLVSKETKHLPFRRSKLTYLLREAIGGNCRTAVLANVWPEKENNRETISTFQFATELSKVMNNSKVNTMEPIELRIERLQEELKILEAEAELQSELAGNVKIDGLKQEEEQQVSELVSLFLSDEIDSLPLQSVAHAKAIFSEIKKKYLDIPNAVMREVGANFILTERVKNMKAPKDVGTIDGTGFSIGVAPSQDRPINIRTVLKSDKSSVSGNSRADNPPVPTKEQMFEIYKLRDGKITSSELIDAKKQTKDLVAKKKVVVETVNRLHDEMVNLSKDIEDKGLRKKDKLYEEEAALITKDIELKNEYKNLYSEIQKIQSEIDQLKEKCGVIRNSVMTSFDEWYNKWINDELYTELLVALSKDSDGTPNGKESAASRNNNKGKGKDPVKPIKKPPPQKVKK